MQKVQKRRGKFLLASAPREKIGKLFLHLQGIEFCILVALSYKHSRIAFCPSGGHCMTIYFRKKWKNESPEEALQPHFNNTAVHL
jgi:hypothetical protein